MQTRNGCCSILFALLFVVTFALCEEDIDPFFNLNESQDLVDPHSFHYDKVSKKMIKNEEDSIDTEATVADNPISDEPFLKAGAPIIIETKQNEIVGCTEERIFYTRLIKLLMANLNVERKDGNPIMATVHLEITDVQMETLRNMKSEKISFREIDAIVTQIIKRPSFNFISEAIHTMENLMHQFEFVFWKISQHTQAITLGVIILVAVFMVRRRGPMARGLPICILIQVIVVVSFLMSWWQLIQEAEIKRRAAQMVYSEIPIACQPDKMNMWHKFVATVYPTNDCEKYYEAMMTEANLKVTPVMALSHLVSSVVVYPMSNIGEGISRFADKATERLSPWYAWSVKLMLFSFVGVVMVVLPFILCGASFNIGLGPFFKFGIDCKKEKNRRNSTELKSLRRDPPIQIILQMHHGNSVPAISTVSESGEVEALTSLPNTETLKTDEETKAICEKPVSLTEDDCRSSTESSIEGDTIYPTSSSDYCRKRISKVEIGAGDG